MDIETSYFVSVTEIGFVHCGIFYTLYMSHVLDRLSSIPDIG